MTTCRLLRVSEGYQTFDHTGDLGLEVWAETPERLYALSAEALLAQVAETTSPAIEVCVAVVLDGDDPSDLMVHWLNHVLLHAELERAVWTQVTVERLTTRRLEGRLEGPRLDPARDVLLREVKAVSYHHLALDLGPGGCRCRLVLDI